MEIQMYQPEPAIDWSSFIHALEKEKGFNHRGFYPSEYSEEGKAWKLEWLIKNGFGEFQHCLDKPEGSITDWSKDSFEMTKRIEINNAWRNDGKSNEWSKKYPYVNFWHFILDRHDISNGSYFTLSRSDETDWHSIAQGYLCGRSIDEDQATAEACVYALKTIEDAIFEAASDYVEDDSIRFWVSW